MLSISLVSVDLTTACNRSCPDCCCDIPNRPSVHHPWEYFERLAPYIYGVHRVHVTGGEPTAHPQFGEFIPRFKDLFGCQELTIYTNGFRVRENAAAMKCFDRIYATRYPDNTDAIQWLSDEFGAQVGDAVHVSRSHRGGGRPCHRGLGDSATYSDGRMFPCCVGPGIPGAQSIELTGDWRDRLRSVPVPCEDCWFSQ